ncbi:hypothetical protein SAMN05444362_11140 [Dysgonomonas macrotermitis]|uniref:Uncharacterized protein n=1 Tax=Dysgonomonas macrotermitis TaxID=1346286 RepID=A0A1M5F3V7_9BACT|nr:hypothetical protein [Dysgonomonas macrotermitis]SHF86058.1 hypothetical protein SAMN05444362_11140 [Dysgonomonas macrotermitis]
MDNTTLSENISYFRGTKPIENRLIGLHGIGIYPIIYHLTVVLVT